MLSLKPCSTALSLALAGATLLLGAPARSAPTTEMRVLTQAYPVYCHAGGTMRTEILDQGGSVEVDTSFTWASAGAGAQPPAAGECAWADRGPRGDEIKSKNGNFLCDKAGSEFHAIFGAGHATENSGENQPLSMAPVVVEFPGSAEFAYVPGIVSGDGYYKFAAYRDPSEGNCLHVTKFLGSANPPFSASPSL
jgi:hypothetical protein